MVLPTAAAKAQTAEDQEVNESYHRKPWPEPGHHQQTDDKEDLWSWQQTRGCSGRKDSYCR